MHEIDLYIHRRRSNIYQIRSLASRYSSLMLVHWKDKRILDLCESTVRNRCTEKSISLALLLDRSIMLRRCTGKQNYLLIRVFWDLAACCRRVPAACCCCCCYALHGERGVKSRLPDARQALVFHGTTTCRENFAGRFDDCW